MPEIKMPALSKPDLNRRVKADLNTLPMVRPSIANSSMPKGEKAILTVLAQFPEGRSKVQVAILTGYAHNGGGFSNYVSSLRTRGLIEGDNNRLTITDDGKTELGEWDTLPSGDALIQYWLGRLGKCERACLEALCSEYPAAIPKEVLANATGYEASGGGFNNALSKLRTLELIEGRQELKASSVFFE